MGFSRQEYWNGLPSPSPGDTLNQKWQNRIFSSSLKYKNNSIWYTGLNCFTDTKAPTEWRKLTTWWQRAHSPQTGWSVRVKLTPVILPFYLPINRSENCAWVDHVPWNSTPSSCLKNASLSIQSWCSVTTWRDGVVSKMAGGFKMEGTHVYLWPIHIDV